MKAFPVAFTVAAMLAAQPAHSQTDIPDCQSSGIADVFERVSDRLLQKSNIDDTIAEAGRMHQNFTRQLNAGIFRDLHSVPGGDTQNAAMETIANALAKSMRAETQRDPYCVAHAPFMYECYDDNGQTDPDYLATVIVHTDTQETTLCLSGKGASERLPTPIKTRLGNPVSLDMQLELCRGKNVTVDAMNVVNLRMMFMETQASGAVVGSPIGGGPGHHTYDFPLQPHIPYGDMFMSFIEEAQSQKLCQLHP